MSLSIQIIDPVRFSEWDKMLLRTPGASFFHSSAWARVLAESYGYTPFYFTTIENGKFRALAPIMEVNSILTGKRGVSLPFTDYCEPIIDEGIPFQDLFNQIIDLGKKRGWKYIELRGGDKYLRTQDSGIRIQEPGTRNESFPPQPFETYLGHTLDLTKGEGQIFSCLRDSTRRNIRKAKSQGVAAKISSDQEGVRQFYGLNCMTRKEHGLPPQPYHFFERVYHHIISRQLGFFTLALHNSQGIAAGVFFCFGNRAIYKYGASDRKFQDFRANNLLMWEAIRWFCNNGYKSFCFGRTELENTGLRQFKAGWGAEEYRLHYFRYDIRKMSFVVNKSRTRNAERATGNMFLNIFHRMPMPLLKAIGALAYRHMG